METFWEGLGQPERAGGKEEKEKGECGKEKAVVFEGDRGGGKGSLSCWLTQGRKKISSLKERINRRPVKAGRKRGDFGKKKGNSQLQGERICTSRFRHKRRNLPNPAQTRQGGRKNTGSGGKLITGRKGDWGKRVSKN